MAKHLLDYRTVTGENILSEWQIDEEADLTDLPTSQKYYGSLAHTPGFTKIWELGSAGWVEV